MRVLTHSRIAAYRGCPRKHWGLYIAQRRALKVAPELIFGTMIHKCLEAYWRARMTGITDGLLAIALAPISATNIDPFVAARARAMVLCYVSLWDLSAYKVLAVEKKFSFPLIDLHTGKASANWEVGGKIDAILEDQRGDVHLLEHKTTSDDALPGEGYRMRLQNDAQISQYFLGAESLGLEPADLIYDVLKKPRERAYQGTPADKQVRTKKTGMLRAGQHERDETAHEYEQRMIDKMIEHPEDHILRIECTRSVAAREKYHCNLWEWSQKMLQDERSGTHPQNEDFCWKFNRPCEFWEVCTGVTSIENPLRYRLATSVNEELEEEGPAT